MTFGKLEDEFSKRSNETLLDQSTANQQEQLEEVSESLNDQVMMEDRSLEKKKENLSILDDDEFDALLNKAKVKSKQEINPRVYGDDANSQLYVKLISHDLVLSLEFMEGKYEQVTQTVLEKLNAIREDYLDKFFVKNLSGDYQVVSDVLFNRLDEKSPDYLKPQPIQTRDKYSKIITNYHSNIEKEVQWQILIKLQYFEDMLKILKISVDKSTPNQQEQLEKESKFDKDAEDMEELILGEKVERLPLLNDEESDILF